MTDEAGQVGFEIPLTLIEWDEIHGLTVVSGLRDVSSITFVRAIAGPVARFLAVVTDSAWCLGRGPI